MLSSFLPPAVRKIIGVFLDRSRERIVAAVSKPSIPGSCTSSRITAKSSLSRRRRASSPELALINVSPKPARTASSATKFSGRSSTRRILTLSRVSIRVPAHADLLSRQWNVVPLLWTVVLADFGTHGGEKGPDLLQGQNSVDL